MKKLDTLLKLVAEKKKQLDSLRPLPPALIQNLEQWFAIEQIYTSNALEGNTLTRHETALVIEKGITVAGKPLKDHLEAVNYAIALHFVGDLIHKKRSTLTITDILDIHRIILKSIDDEHAGIFRKIAVRISGSTLTLPDPIKVPDLMNEFIQWLTTTADSPIMIAAQAHYRLVSIHPFIDGNGRTARLLMNLLLIQEGYPPAIIPMEKRAAYLAALTEIDATGNYKDFKVLITQAVEHSLDVYLEAAQKSI